MKITQGKPTTQKAKKHKNKIVSKTVPTGTILQTRDEYFQGSGNYRKPGYQNKGLYRKAGVVEQNSKNELAVVKFVSGGNFSVNNTNLKYQPYIEIYDDKNQPIKTGSKFIPTKQVLSTQQVQAIKDNCLKNKQVNKHLRRKNISLLKLL